MLPHELHCTMYGLVTKHETSVITDRSFSNHSISTAFARERLAA